MATLEKIRKHGALLLIIVGAAMLAFILGDFFTSSTSFFNRSRENIGVIEGNNIHYTEYEKAKEQLTEVYKIETGRSDMDEEMQNYINSQVWQTMLVQYTLGNQAKQIGMTVTDNELSELCIGENPHQIIRQRRVFCDQTGQFNRLGLLQFLQGIDQESEDAEQNANLRQARTYWMYWENAVRLTYLQEKYTNLVSELIGANDLDAKYAFNDRQTSVNVQYVEQPYFAIADSLVQVSDKDIRALYKKNKEQYKQEPNRALNYITFAIVPSEQDYADVEKWIHELAPEFSTIASDELASVVNSNSDVIYDGRNYAESDVPEQYKDFAFGKEAHTGAVSDIRFENNTYSMARLVATGFSRADSVKLRYTVLEDATKADSLKAAWKQGEFGDANELDWLQEYALPKEMVEPAFTGAKGDIFTMPYGTGLQVIQIMDKSAATPKVKMAILERKVTPSSKTYATIYNQAKQYIVNNNTAEKFNAAAQEANMTIYPAAGLDKNATKVGDLKQSRPIVRWAFGAEEGNVSDVFECGDQFVVALLTEINEDEYRSIDDMRAELTRELKQNKKAEMMIAKLQGLTSLEAVAEQTGCEVQTAENVNLSAYRFGAAGMEPAVIGAAVGLEEGQLSQPIQGKNGVYVLLCQSKSAQQGEFDAATEKAQLNMRYSYSLPYQIVAMIEDKAEVTDNRSNFF